VRGGNHQRNAGFTLFCQFAYIDYGHLILPSQELPEVLAIGIEFSRERFIAKLSTFHSLIPS
jgi:hypothetical protein